MIFYINCEHKKIVNFSKECDEHKTAALVEEVFIYRWKYITINYSNENINTYREHSKVGWINIGVPQGPGHGPILYNYSCSVNSHFEVCKTLQFISYKQICISLWCAH